MQVKNNSPWLHQLDKERAVLALNEDIKTDVAIIGGGIAGISTAFFILRHTDKSVALFEASRIAHGATGHNAGQVTSYFERPFVELVEEFGLEMAAEGERAILSAWDLIEQMYKEAGLRIPFSRFIGYAGFSSLSQILDELKDNKLRREVGMSVRPILIAKEFENHDSVPGEFEGLFRLVPQKEILQKLETSDESYIGLYEAEKGVVNSALFTEEIAVFLLKKYKGRFRIFENRPISKVVLKKDFALLDAGRHEVKAGDVVLCTNGFENIKIFDPSGLEIDTRFHHLVNGVVARMFGFLSEERKPPTAISYYSASAGSGDEFDDGMSTPYFYLTRREHEHDEKRPTLTCIGGPQYSIPDREEYLREFDFDSEYELTSDKFLRKLKGINEDEFLDYDFNWHGLMGYTPNGVRLVGPEPKNSNLFYNLGCNGVGILPSIFGADKVARQIAGEKFPPSIFDVPERR